MLIKLLNEALDANISLEEIQRSHRLITVDYREKSSSYNTIYNITFHIMFRKLNVL